MFFFQNRLILPVPRQRNTADQFKWTNNLLWHYFASFLFSLCFRSAFVKSAINYYLQYNLYFQPNNAKKVYSYERNPDPCAAQEKLPTYPGSSSSSSDQAPSSSLYSFPSTVKARRAFSSRAGSTFWWGEFYRVLYFWYLDF